MKRPDGFVGLIAVLKRCCASAAAVTLPHSFVGRLLLGLVQTRDVDRQRLVRLNVVQVGHHHRAVGREEEDAGVADAVGAIVLGAVDHVAVTAATRLDDFVFGRDLASVGRDLALGDVVADDLAERHQVQVAHLGRRLLALALLLEVLDLQGVALAGRGLLLLAAFVVLGCTRREGAGADDYCDDDRGDALPESGRQII